MSTIREAKAHLADVETRMGEAAEVLATLADALCDHPGAVRLIRVADPRDTSPRSETVRIRASEYPSLTDIRTLLAEWEQAKAKMEQAKAYLARARSTRKRAA